MLYAFGFERVGVVASDMYIVIPTPLPGQEGAERGVRLEVRLLERGELRGSAYSARPIEVGRPAWRGVHPAAAGSAPRVPAPRRRPPPLHPLWAGAGAERHRPAGQPRR